MKLYSIFTLLPILLGIHWATPASAMCPAGCICNEELFHVNCVNANLDIVPITLNPSIQRLILKNNKIRSVDNDLKFYHELLHVDLGHNNLVRIQPGSFVSQGKLVELYLNGNKISQLSNRTFGASNSPMVSLAVLNVQNNLIDSLDPGVFQYAENLVELDLSQNSIKDIGIGAFLGLSKLRILRLDNNEFTQVPDVFSSRTPIPSYLTSINKGGGSNDQFKNGMVPHLAELYLSNNQIDKIKSDAFTAAKNLVTLDLHGCRISTIDQHAFRGLTVLRKLVLTDNNLMNIPTTSFPPLIQLEVLKLGRNNFDRISKFAFGGLKKLKTLEIKGAPELTLIDSEAFAPNLDLETVELSNCKKLATMPPKLFKGLSGLKNIILTDNSLQGLSEDMASWTSLRSLRLEGNPLHCDCEMFWLKDVLLQNRLRNTSSFVLCTEPREVRDKKFIEISSHDLNCYLQGPVQKTILGISVFVAVIFLIVFFFLLYKYHDKIKNTCKRGFRRPSRRKNRSSVISSSAKELDTAAKSSFLSQSAYPFSDDEFQVRTSLMSGSPGPGSGFLHASHHSHTLNPVTMNSLNYPYGTNNSHNNHSLRYPLNHHHHHHNPHHHNNHHTSIANANKYSSPSYNEYDAPINAVNFPQYSQQQTPSQIDLPIQYPLHHGTLPVPGVKPIPITEL